MPNIMELLPNLDDREMAYVQGLIKDFSDEQARQFALAYGAKRRDPLLILLTACIGFLGFAGIHRFILDHIGLGILYLFTAGICFVGTIIDLVNYKQLAFEYNQNVAARTAQMVRSSG
jgi:TM2 domain-containing membrane protein YozV